ncbi:ATP-binding protein [Geotalea uraniireducens]|uniref:ATP-binding protein n=1 Tax=Geotalea uraniireducens TaxID=351604 RepID=UPI0032B5C9CC
MSGGDWRFRSSRALYPFQRLAVTEEYGGYGIGLATVERTTTHHGGKVWAEGELGKRATVFFTLGDSE